MKGVELVFQNGSSKRLRKEMEKGKIDRNIHAHMTDSRREDYENGFEKFTILVELSDSHLYKNVETILELATVKPTEEEIQLALLQAAVHGQDKTVRVLLRHGAIPTKKIVRAAVGDCQYRSFFELAKKTDPKDLLNWKEEFIQLCDKEIDYYTKDVDYLSAKANLTSARYAKKIKKMLINL